METNTHKIQRLLLAVRKSMPALSQRENTSLLWEHAPLGASESNDIFKNATLGGGRNITIQLCLNILRLSLRPLHQFFFSLQQWNKIDKVNFFTLKFNLSLVFLSKENCILLQSALSSNLPLYLVKYKKILLSWRSLLFHGITS